MSGHDALLAVVERFLEAEKEVRGQLRWRDKAHPDYVEAKLFVAVTAGGSESAEVILTANTGFSPPKFGFALIFRGIRVLGLDVDPARTHFNASTKAIVSSTHWQRWPGMEARPDGRSLDHKQWLSEFLEAANIRNAIRYKAPRGRDRQLDLPL